MFNASIIEMGFVPIVADPDAYQRTTAKPDGFKYHEYILVYVDNVLIISHSPQEHLDRIKATYALNPNSIGPSKRYLGADVEKVTRPNDPIGKDYWSFSAASYVKNAVKKNMNLMLLEEGRYLKTTAQTPFSSTTYRPDMDTSDECNNEMASRFMHLIGVLRWAVDLGRLNIYTEVSLLSQQMALPRVGHLLGGSLSHIWLPHET